MLLLAASGKAMPPCVLCCAQLPKPNLAVAPASCDFEVALSAVQGGMTILAIVNMPLCCWGH